MVKAPTTSAAEKAMAAFDERFEKNFGKGTLISAADVPPYEVISTGSLTLDYALGVGGYPEGRIIEIWGPDNLGKTTFALLYAREAQRKYPGKRVAFIDAEGKLDIKWAAIHGVDLSPSRFKIFNPENAEDVADAAKSFIDSGLFSVVILDSVGTLISKAAKGKDADKAVVADVARIVTRMVNIAASEGRRTSTTLFVVNQIRARIATFGADTQQAGGNALRYASTVKLAIRRAEGEFKISRDGETISVGHALAIKVERNKTAPSPRTAMITLITQPSAKYGPVGVDKADEAATLGVKTGVIHQAGAWYTLPESGERFQGREKLVEALRKQPEIVEMLRTKIIATLADEVITGDEAEPEYDPETGFRGIEALVGEG